MIKTHNAQGGSDARYIPENDAERRLLDSDGRPLGSEAWLYPGLNEWTNGLPGAREMNAEGVGGGGGAGGGSSMFGNPYFQQFQAASQAQQTADLSDTKSQIQQILIQLGLVPGNFQDKIGALDDTIRQLIEQNTQSGISQYARMLENKGDVQRSTISRLGTKGLLRSGAKGYRMRRNQLDFDRSFSDTLNAVLSNVGQIQSGYANREYGRQMSLAQFLASLFSGFSGGGGGGGGGGAPAPQTYAPPPAPAWQSLSPGATGTPTIGGGWVGTPAPPINLGGGSGTSSKKPLLF